MGHVRASGPIEGRLGNVTGALLVGGASSRMGRDKARTELEGVALATRSALLLDSLFEQVLVVGGEAPPDAPGRWAPDPPGPRCALRGLVGALAEASGERVLVLATDLPLVTPDLLLALVAWPERDAVVPRTPDGPHPLCAIYRRGTALPAARARLEAGRLELRGLLDDLEVDHLEGPDLAAVDPEGVALVNVNTPEDLERVRGLLAQ